MKGRVHLVSGIILSAGIIAGASYQGRFINPENIVPLVSTCLLGSIFPDIDNKKSTIGRPLFILRPFQGGQNHRNKLTHTPIFLLLSILLFKMVYEGPHADALLFGWTAGYLLHLILDTFTSGGIRWVYPIGRKPISLFTLSSGAWVEAAVMAVICMPSCQLAISALKAFPTI